MSAVKLLRGVLFVASIGLALHLILPQIPGIERSARLLTDASHVLVAAALAAEILSELCYARLLQSFVSGLRRAGVRRSPNLWFFLRLTVTGYGAAHVLPGGGATASAIDYRALRSRGYDAASVARTLATVAAFVYAALGLLFASGLVYLLANHDLSVPGAVGAMVLLTLPLLLVVATYVSGKRPGSLERPLGRMLYGVVRVFRRGYARPVMQVRARRLVERLADEYRAIRVELQHDPRRAARLFSLAFGFWAFDALCLILVFQALGVRAGVVPLLVAYGVATVAGSLPLTPGGIGVFETTMLATLALLGVGSEAAIPILGYRLFNFWLPIPLAALFYPTLHMKGPVASA